ncbi:hypothetical protein ACFPYI_18585 [Halomarina salina]|uniref:Uncharacterized protein n=1 Tax=Halomarina salina TaxID=1872699 RepID=A0ABD5RS35_9EURY|nr:hypothetical protein [Halomarina salina]
MRAAATLVSAPGIDRLRQLPPGRRVTVSREGDAIPPGFARSPFTLPLTARTVYRECRATDSLVLSVFDDRVVVRRERYHPQRHPLRHLLFDRFAVFLVVAVAWLLARRRRRVNDTRR